MKHCSFLRFNPIVTLFEDDYRSKVDYLVNISRIDCPEIRIDTAFLTLKRKKSLLQTRHKPAARPHGYREPVKAFRTTTRNTRGGNQDSEGNRGYHQLTKDDKEREYLLSGTKGSHQQSGKAHPPKTSDRFRPSFDSHRSLP